MELGPTTMMQVWLEKQMTSSPARLPPLSIPIAQKFTASTLGQGHLHFHLQHNQPNPSQWRRSTVSLLCTPRPRHSRRPPSSLFTLATTPPYPHHRTARLTSAPDLPPIKPSAIALGTVFSHAASLAVLGPVFGETYRQAQAANSKEEFFKSKEAASAGAAWGTSLVGSAIQTYGVGALLNATGTLSYKGAAYLGTLVFFASSAPSVSYLFSL